MFTRNAIALLLGSCLAMAAEAQSPVQTPGPEQIVGTYAVRSFPGPACPAGIECYSGVTRSIRFAADGTVQTTDGHTGTWKVFDKDALIYSVALERNRWSMKLLPGRGLADVNNPADPIFVLLK